ncbi:hypothetical protein I552_0554 [Mycobacterium xenopi 3993]|nr:hypothetical protein I552_0554 [Mycobacterium xenopi 3993]
MGHQYSPLKQLGQVGSDIGEAGVPASMSRVKPWMSVGPDPLPVEQTDNRPLYDAARDIARAARLITRDVSGCIPDVSTSTTAQLRWLSNGRW